MKNTHIFQALGGQLRDLIKQQDAFKLPGITTSPTKLHDITVITSDVQSGRIVTLDNDSYDLYSVYDHNALRNVAWNFTDFLSMICSR